MVKIVYLVCFLFTCHDHEPFERHLYKDKFLYVSLKHIRLGKGLREEISKILSKKNIELDSMNYPHSIGSISSKSPDKLENYCVCIALKIGRFCWGSFT